MHLKIVNTLMEDPYKRRGSIARETAVTLAFSVLTLLIIIVTHFFIIQVQITTFKIYYLSNFF